MAVADAQHAHAIVCVDPDDTCVREMGVRERSSHRERCWAVDFDLPEIDGSAVVAQCKQRRRVDAVGGDVSGIDGLGILAHGAENAR